MDLGCIDADGVLHSPTREADALSSNSKISKNKLTKEAGQSSSGALNKLTSQIRKPPRRKTSPINWFPRKKVDSYLKRKIKMLQEVDGMHLTLDQTLGDSNPHYSRVLREKMAAREAAHKAIEARRAALVEACWCRILRAARIPSDDAEAQLLKAEKSEAEAFEAAQAMGVIMFDLPNCHRKHCQIETSSVNGEGSSTHTVTASFETAFEVDKEVAAAVKTALMKLANCPSFSKDEFRSLLRKISENPDADESNQDLSKFSAEYETRSGSELDSVSQDYNSQDLDSKMPFMGVSQTKSRRQSLDNRVKLVDMMIERLKCLQEDELSSLATIVATYGLNAALVEVQNIKLHNPGSATEHTSSINFPARRMSSLGFGKSALDGKMRKKQVEPELPSLDKFLVKHMTKLEREVWEAKKNRRNETESDRDSSRKSVDGGTPLDTVPDLGSILVKNYTKLEKDIQEAKNKSGKETAGVPRGMLNRQKDHTEVPSLDKFLVKHVSRLEKEVQEAKNRTINENKSLKKKVDLDTSGGLDSTFYSDEALDTKENINLNQEIDTGSKDTKETAGVPRGMLNRQKDHSEVPSLDKFLVKHVSRLEKEVQEAKNRTINENKSLKKKVDLDTSGGLDSTFYSDEALDTKENINLNQEIDTGSKVEKKDCKLNRGISSSDGSNDDIEENKDGLEKILKKPVHRLEREKMQALSLGSHGENYRQRKNNEAINVTDWESLDKIFVKHVSRLEKEKMRINSGEERDEVKRSHRNIHLETNEEGGLDQVLVKHKSRLEREKMVAAAQQSENPVSLSKTRREARERELQEAWGGLSLGNSIKPRLSKLELDKAAWIKAEEEERRQAMKAI